MELTDREFMIKMEGHLERLSEAIERLGDGLKNLEEKKLSVIEQDLAELKNWKAQINGGWKLAIGMWVVITFLASLAFSKFF